MSDSADTPRPAIGELVAFAHGILERAGVPADIAHLVADTLVDADARGIGSHGVARLPIYVQRIHAGVVDPSAVPVVETRGAVASVDARNGMGPLAARTGMDAATERAEALGIGFARVRGSNHAGAMGYYARAAARRGYVAIAASNAPLLMAYFGGRTRGVGTNPFAIAVPRRDAPPITLDVATAAVARGKIVMAAAEGRPIPEGWAIDVDGVPTTDAQKALEGSVLPFGGPKGSGLAMMIDLFCGVLAGADFGRHVGHLYDNWTQPQNVGHVFLAVRPEDLDGTFLPGVEEFVSDVASLPPAAGSDRILLPGEIEEMALGRAVAGGVSIADSTVVALAGLARELGHPVPPFLVPAGA